MTLRPKPSRISDLTLTERDLFYRVGSALLIHWDLLSDESQEAIKSQAADIIDGAPIVQAEFQIEEFIEKFKGGVNA